MHIWEEGFLRPQAGAALAYLHAMMVPWLPRAAAAAVPDRNPTGISKIRLLRWFIETSSPILKHEIGSC